MLHSRPACEKLDALIASGAVTHVLDHGFVRVVDYMGDQSAIVQAARVSYGRGTKTQSEDRGLIRYLMRHRHTTPFEMCELKLHVKLPIFVARQWIRHRTASVNEYSARYSVLDREFYLPVPEDVCEQSDANKQGRACALPEAQAAAVIDALSKHSDASFDLYDWMLNSGSDGEPIDEDRAQLSRELARVGLTLNTYTQWYWKIDLHNLLHFLSLRADAHAQKEFRAYADAIWQIVRAWVPDVADAFDEYVGRAVKLSVTEIDVISSVICELGVSVSDVMRLSATALGKREAQELREKLERLGFAHT